MYWHSRLVFLCLYVYLSDRECSSVPLVGFWLDHRLVPGPANGVPGILGVLADLEAGCTIRGSMPAVADFAARHDCWHLFQCRGLVAVQFVQVLYNFGHDFNWPVVGSLFFHVDCFRHPVRVRVFAQSFGQEK